MANMTFTPATAKSLCTAEEFRLFQQAQPAQLEKLTLVQLKDHVTRSRTARDKWRDVSRTQKRSTQSGKGHRQTVDNSRSTDKALLLQEVHDAFVQRLKAVESNQAQVVKGKRPASVPRADRKIVNRASRSLTKGALADEKRQVNKQAKQAENARDAAKSAESTAAGATKKKVVKKTASKKTAAKKKTGSAASAKKKPVVSPARKRALAQKAAAAKLAPPAEKTSQTPKSTTGLSSSKMTAKNRPVKTKASQNRISRGGATRIRGHVQASGARKQARRDSK
jgi:hypothetical protein